MLRLAVAHSSADPMQCDRKKGKEKRADDAMGCDASVLEKKKSEQGKVDETYEILSS
jgi:hypothetical protein